MTLRPIATGPDLPPAVVGELVVLGAAGWPGGVGVDGRTGQPR
jgi:hypothetical protein